MQKFAKKAGEVTTALLQTGTCNLLNGRQLDNVATPARKVPGYKAPVTVDRKVPELG